MPRPSARSRRSRLPPSTPRSGICGPRKQRLPLWKLAGGAKDRCPLYTTEGGWLHIETAGAGRRCAGGEGQGFPGSKVKIGKPHGAEDFARLSAVRKAVGDGYEIMTDCNQGFSVDEAIRRAEPPARPRPRLDRGAAAGRRHRRPRAAVELDLDADRRRQVALFDPAFPRIHAEGRLHHRPGGCRPHRRHHAVARRSPMRRRPSTCRSARIS